MSGQADSTLRGAHPSGGSRVLTWAASAAVAVTTLWVLWTAQREVRADFTSGSARFITQRWAEGLAQPASRSQWEAERSELEEAVQIQPVSASLHESLGTAWMVGAAQTWAEPADRQRWLGYAQRHYTIATQLRPSDGLTWALLASAMARAGKTGPEMHTSAEQALKLGPREGHVQQAVLSLVLEHWDAVSPALQQWAGELFDRGTQAQREAINRMGEPFGIVLESTLPAQEPRSKKKQGAS